MAKMTVVRSSTINSVGHDPETSEMTVNFSNGGSYVYDGVPAALYQALLDSPSAGSFLHRHIKGRYAYRKVG